MAKKSGGLLTLVTGLVAGAAAVFFADKKNRQETAKALDKAKTTALKAKEDYEKNPTAFKKKVKTQGKKLAQKVVKTAQTKVAKATKTTKKVAKKTAKKKSAKK